MKYSLLLITLFFFTACTKSIKKETLTQLNGYWEITEVEFTNGQKKTYKVNPTIDYINIEGLKGFKKKVQPKFNGSYDITNDAEAFTIIEKEGVFFFSYKNALSTWEEKLVSLEEDTFSILNDEDITYTYKRYQPLNIE